MSLDLNKYRKYVDDFDLTEEEKTELIQTVFSIMESFVDQAFGLHPVQQIWGKQKDLQSPTQEVESKPNPLTHTLKNPASPKGKRVR
ncbi:MAG: hypothetical protein ACE5EK_04265 [Nitrospinales bacterium]